MLAAELAVVVGGGAATMTGTAATRVGKGFATSAGVSGSPLVRLQIDSRSPSGP